MAYQTRHRNYRRRKPRYKIVLSIVLGILLAVLLIYPFLEPLTITKDRMSLVCPDLPADVNLLKIVYVSDIHMGGSFSASRVRELVSSINAENPDLVLLGGDYANDSDGAIQFFRQLPAIHARYAVCAVLGEKDRTEPESNLAILKGAMYSAGVTPLVNEAA